MRIHGNCGADHKRETCTCSHEHHGEQSCNCGHEYHEKHGCDCGHDHHEEHSCGCCHNHPADHGCGCGCGHEHHTHHQDGEQGEKRELLIGAALFAAGWGLSAVFPEIWVQLPVFVLAWFVLGRHVLMNAGRNLMRGHILDENFLMGIATVGAFLIGEYPEAVGIMLFYRVGEFFEHRAVERSRKSILDAVDLRPEEVECITGEKIPAAQAKAGDLLTIRPGDRVPLDGIVVSGTSRMDTAPITGESVPVTVGEGDRILSGCINGSGLLTMRVEKVLEESMVTRILNSVENAAASKPRIDRFITRFSKVYTPIVVSLAAAVAVIPPLFTGEWRYWCYTAISFLVMSCPCALVLSVPLTFFAGIGTGSRKGILFKGGMAMEALAGIKAVAMDKTGTVTKGDFRVTKIVGGEELLWQCACCESTSNHPIAASITDAAKERGMAIHAPQAMEEMPGYGIRAMLDGEELLCGKEAWLTRSGILLPDLPEEYSGVRVLVAVNGQYAGYLEISDTVKAEAKNAVTKIKSMGLATAMLTGDSETEAKAVSNQTGIDEVYAGLLPDEKLESLTQLRGKYGPVMFVGDGINDAPVLSGADVGAAMGSGTDAAIEAADVVFMTSRVDAIPEALRIAASTKHIALQNVIFALAVKLLVMLLGVLGSASMWAAVFADSGVAMLCVLNAVRLLYRKP